MHYSKPCIVALATFSFAAFSSVAQADNFSVNINAAPAYPGYVETPIEPVPYTYYHPASYYDHHHYYDWHYWHGGVRGDGHGHLEHEDHGGHR